MGRRATTFVLLAAACGADTPGDAPIALQFTPDPGPVGSERYQCFGFPLAPLGGADLGGIAFVAADGPVALHHIALYASPAVIPRGPVDCLSMPVEAVPMNVWAPGGGDLALPDDVSLVIPDGATHLIVQTHGLRTDEGAAVEREIVLAPRPAAQHRAGWLPLRAPTPVIYPFRREESVASCSIAGELRVISTWPHMHQIGAEFHGRVQRASASEALVDVVPWSFDAQHAYPVDVTITAGEAIETHCVWQNDSDRTVLPGPGIDDEMCGQSLIGYPHEAARCL